MIYTYEKCEGYKLYGSDFLPIRELCMVYKDGVAYLDRKTHQFRLVILRLGSKLSEQEREDYTLIYKDLAHRLQVLHEERIALEAEIAASFDELLLKKIAANNGTVRHESDRNHRSNRQDKPKSRKH